MSNKKIWFAVPRGQTHELIEDEDGRRFPLGRAKCAPFPRHKNDAIFDTNEIHSKDFCTLCISSQ